MAHRATSSQNAQIIQQMLISTVEQGTASAARIDRYTVGKTGTAQPGGDQENHAWFVACVQDDAHPPWPSPWWWKTAAPAAGGRPGGGTGAQGRPGRGQLNGL